MKKKRSSSKGIIGIILVFGGFVVCIGCAIAFTVMQFKNVDMTYTRLLIEHWPLAAGCVGGAVAFYGGREMLRR